MENQNKRCSNRWRPTGTPSLMGGTWRVSTYKDRMSRWVTTSSGSGKGRSES
jgi:hypothetical protein